MHRDTNLMALQFLEDQSGQGLWRHLHQESRMEFSLIESAQHFLCGQIVKLHMHTRIGLPEVLQRTRQKFDRQ